MPQTALDIQPLSPPLGRSMDRFEYAPADLENGNSYRSTGREILLARNTSTTETGVLEVFAVADRLGRVENLEQEFEPGVERALMLPVQGWRNADRLVTMLANLADIELAVIRLATSFE